MVDDVLLEIALLVLWAFFLRRRADVELLLHDVESLVGVFDITHLLDDNRWRLSSPALHL